MYQPYQQEHPSGGRERLGRAICNINNNRNSKWLSSLFGFISEELRLRLDESLAEQAAQGVSQEPHTAS